jgi:superfamily II DNA or RNA helicase
LKLWNKRRAERDLVIKLNTGGGKTLVGLLIGQALLNELHKPVLCLCPTRQLVQQTLEKGREVSISAVGYETGPSELPKAFLNGNCILVATYNAVFNGRSKFGILGSGSEPVLVGAARA